MKIQVKLIVLLGIAFTLTMPVRALEVTRVAEGFFVPWSLAFLPDDSLLVTERDGTLWRVLPDGQRVEITGLPRVAATGQGGLLDIVVARDFARSSQLLFSYAKPQKTGQGTALAIARLDIKKHRLQDLQVLFEMAPGSRGGRHFGGRIVEAPDGTLFLSIGDRGDRPAAQDLSRHNGSVIRINRDGTIPKDNPFVSTPGARPEIWSFGHRNPQGLSLDATGQLWANEHGAQGGDEVNRISKGANYGWPVIAYGRHYNGRKIGIGTHQAGMQQPVHFWDPSIAPPGMMVYDGDLFPNWRGDLFVGSLKFDYISRLSGTPLREVEQIRLAETGRVRDVRQGPDGAIWFLSETEGAVFRLTP